MKKSIKLLTGTLLIGLLLFTVSCKKDHTAEANTNTAVIKLNGVQQEVDSVIAQVVPSISETLISVYLNHNPLSSCVIWMVFPLADPSAIAGASIDLTTGFAGGYEGVDYYNGNTYFADDSSLPSAYSHSGTITITKNDVPARRIEGTLANCIAARTSGSGSNSVIIDGSFAVTYPSK